jgi:hypothetical protein
MNAQITESRVALPHEETRRRLEDLDRLLQFGVAALELADLPRQSGRHSLGLPAVNPGLPQPLPIKKVCTEPGREAAFHPHWTCPKNSFIR